MPATIISADWVICDSGTVLPLGQVRLSGGLISDVGTDLPQRFPRDPVHHCSGCVLMPGLVNAHTHLELTLLRGIGRGLPFADWIARMTSEVLAADRSVFQDSVPAGIRECLRGGVTTVADHSTFGFSPGGLNRAGMRAVVFREMFSPDPDADYTAGMQDLAAALDQMREDAGQDVVVGVSCHAPYNASKSAIRAVVTGLKSYPRSIHAAESPDEMSYIRHGDGVIAGRHRARGFRVEPRRMSPVEYLDYCSYWSPGSLAVHLTQASQGDLVILKSREGRVAFCPSSNASLGVGVPPIALARRLGLKCGLGTDSAVSCERLDMFEEMRFAVLSSKLKNDPISSTDAFNMATLEGAQALGMEDIGSLAPGKRADMVALRLDRPGTEGSVVDSVVWQGSSSEVEAVWVKGDLAIDNAAGAVARL